jgi:hypothetical protein
VRIDNDITLRYRQYLIQRTTPTDHRRHTLPCLTARPPRQRRLRRWRHRDGKQYRFQASIDLLGIWHADMEIGCRGWRMSYYVRRQASENRSESRSHGGGDCRVRAERKRRGGKKGRRVSNHPPHGDVLYCPVLYCTDTDRQDTAESPSIAGQQDSRRGGEHAHIVVTYRTVLSVLEAVTGCTYWMYSTVLSCPVCIQRTLSGPGSST